MNIEEQIELFYDAEFVVAPHGAGLSNIMFSRGIKVLELFPTPQVLPHYFYLSKSLGHEYKYWCGNKMFKDSNFRVNISEIMKLVNNLVLGSFMATLAEALALGEDIGIDKKQVLEILSVGGGNSLVLNAKKNKLLDEDFSTHFSTALIYPLPKHIGQ